MGFMRVEEVTLPARFLIKTAHFIAILTIVFDLDAVAVNMTQTNPRTATGAALDHYNKTKQTVSGLTYAALACFGIEYITLFMGVTIFMRSLNLLNIVAHGTGLVLTVLLYVDNWDVSALGALFAVFNVLPTVLELSVLFLASKFAFLKY